MITAPGIGSGLDVEGIITQLMSIERRPLTALDAKETAFNTQLSDYGTLKSDLSSFQTEAKKIKDTTAFNAYTATPADPTIFTSSPSTSSIPGNYSISVTQLAAAQKIVATGQTASNTAIGTGASTTLTIDFGTIGGGTFNATTGKYTGATFTLNPSKTTKTVTIGSTDNTLEGIRDAINAVDIGVKASIVNDGSALPFRLVLTPSDGGVSNSLRIGVAGDATLQTLLAQDPAGTQNMMQTVTAQDALLTVDGLSMTKTSNTITDVIQGTTLNLTKTGSTSLSILRDNDAITKDITKMVDAFNQFRERIKSLRLSSLNGDNTLLSIESQMTSIFSTPASGLTGQFSYLAEVGISFQKDGTLAIDSSILKNKLDTNYQDVVELFTHVDQGFAYRLEQTAKDILKFDGVIENKTDGLNQRIKDLTTDRDRLERRMIGIEDRLRAQFTALDGLLSSLQTTSNFLTQQLDNLPTIGKN
ncbi:MAG: flagellar filament capping protein FliD [Nitrospiria bacterium]